MLTLPFVGLGGYADYLTVVRNLSSVTGVAHNVDLASAALLLGLGPGVVQPALIVQYALMTGLMRSMRASTASISSTGDSALERINRDSSVAGV